MNFEKEIYNLPKTIQEEVDRIIKNRNKIIDDFIKVYLASRAEYILKNPRNLERLVLVIQRTPTGEEYFLKIKPGRLKKEVKGCVK